MKVQSLEFGRIVIDNQSYSEDIIIDRGQVYPREKSASRRYKGQYGHTPLSAEENIPWNCKRLIIGSGLYGSLPVMPEVKQRAAELGVELVIKPTAEALHHLDEDNTNFVLHLTC